MTYLNDLRDIVQSLEPLKSELAGKPVLVTGGTGFLGRWLTDSLTQIGAKPVVIARKRNDEVSGECIEGDLLDPNLWESMNKTSASSCKDIVHAANDYTFTADQIFEMGKRTFDFAERIGAKRVMFVSSGAVYSASENGPTRYLENEALATDLSKVHPYAAGKIRVEREGLSRAAQGKFEFKVVRGFAFLGPHQVLSSHFAAAQFFKSFVEDKSIVLNSAGTSIRSYLYPTDFVVGAIQVLLRGKSSAIYNLGSKEQVRIVDLARMVSAQKRPNPLSVTTKPSDSTSLSTADVYVPNLERIEHELGYRSKVKLEEAVSRTAKFYEEIARSSATRA